MGKRIEMVGKRFGRLVVIKESKKSGRSIYWKCKCDCGNFKIIQGRHLRSGDIKSCGCLKKELSMKRYTTHGMRDSPEYQSWKSMLHRCNNKNCLDYESYGGRGVSVCQRWTKFANFYTDMGSRPEGKTLDRFPDNKGNYEPGNCRWGSAIEQSRNRRIPKNNKTGIMGVSWNEQTKKYRVSIKANYKSYTVGRCNTLEQARKLRIAAEHLYWGDSSL